MTVHIQIPVSPVGIAVHLIQQGNNRPACFVSDEGHGAYAGWLKEYAQKQKVEIHSWVIYLPCPFTMHPLAGRRYKSNDAVSRPPVCSIF